MDNRIAVVLFPGVMQRELWQMKPLAAKLYKLPLVSSF